MDSKGAMAVVSTATRGDHSKPQTWQPHPREPIRGGSHPARSEGAERLTPPAPEPDRERPALARAAATELAVGTDAEARPSAVAPAPVRPSVCRAHLRGACEGSIQHAPRCGRIQFLARNRSSAPSPRPPPWVGRLRLRDTESRITQSIRVRRPGCTQTGPAESGGGEWGREE